jgi:hypothetical protein
MKRILLLSQDPKKWIHNRRVRRDEFNTIYNNTGNLVWQYAIAKILHCASNQITIERHPYDENDCGVTFASGPPEVVNERFDHVVFSGANVISRRQVWRLEKLKPFLSGLKVPVTVCSIGAQADHDDHQLLHGIEGSVKDFVRSVLALGPSIGVRGEFTADYLRKLGFAKHVCAIGCPSFYMRGQNAVFGSPEQQISDAKALIGDTPAIRGQLFRKAQQIFRDNYNVVSQSYVEEAAELEYEELAAIRSRKMYRFTAFHNWKAFAGAHSVSLSGRIHGTVVALHSGIPVILVALDRRTEELGKHIGIPTITVGALEKLDSVKDLAELWRGSSVNIRYGERYKEFMQYVNSHKLTHWESCKAEGSSDYYEKLLGQHAISTAAESSLTEYKPSHQLYAKPPFYLALAFVETHCKRIMAKIKRELKAMIRGLKKEHAHARP